MIYGEVKTGVTYFNQLLYTAGAGPLRDIGLPLPLSSYVEALTPSRTVLEDGAAEEVIKIKQGHKSGILVQ